MGDLATVRVDDLDLEYVHKKKFYGRRITDTDARGVVQPAEVRAGVLVVRVVRRELTAARAARADEHPVRAEAGPQRRVVEGLAEGADDGFRVLDAELVELATSS